MELFIRFSVLLVVTLAGRNRLTGEWKEKTTHKIDEVGGSIIGRLCKIPTNDFVCCIERYTLDGLLDTYPPIIPHNLNELDTSIPEDPLLYINGFDPRERLRSRWACEIPSQWTPNLVEPYVVNVWYKEVYPDGPLVFDEIRVVSPRCTHLNVELECQYC
jgi:hypothetical protein